MLLAFVSQFDLPQLDTEMAHHTKKNAVNTLPSAPCAFPQAAMTKASLTEMQATSCIPLLFKFSACSTNPGR